MTALNGLEGSMERQIEVGGSGVAVARLALVGAGLAGLSFGLAPAGAGRPGKAAPQPRYAAAGPLALQVRAPRPAPASLPPSGHLSLGELTAAIETSLPRPLARSLGEAFLKEPALAAAWDGYRKAPEAPAAELVERLARLPEFRRLLAGFQGRPGFQAAFQSLSRKPELAPVLRRIRETRVALSGAGSSGGSRRAVQDPRFARRSDSLAAGAFGSTGSASPRLEAPEPVAAVREAVPALESVYARLSPAVRARLERVCEEDGVCEPIAACRAAGVEAECLQAAGAPRDAAAAPRALASARVAGAAAGAGRAATPSAPRTGPSGAIVEPEPGAGGEGKGETPIVPESRWEKAGRSIGAAIGNLVGGLFEALEQPEQGAQWAKSLADTGAALGKALADALARLAQGLVDSLGETLAGLFR